MSDTNLIHVLIMFERGVHITDTHLESLRDHGMRGTFTVLPTLRVVKGLMTAEDMENLPKQELNILVVKKEDTMEAAQ